MTPQEKEAAQQCHEHQQQLFREAADKGEAIDKMIERIASETREEWMKLLPPPDALPERPAL